MRCLLIEDGKNLILIDNGLGNKQDDKFFGHYDLWGNATLDKSLAKYGFVKDDITDVFLTHLHFDHCGGSVEWNDDRSGYRTAFKTPDTGVMKIIGNGQQNPIQERKQVFKRKYPSYSGKRTA